MPDYAYPTLPDVYRARRVNTPYLSPTALRHYPTLSSRSHRFTESLLD